MDKKESIEKKMNFIPQTHPEIIIALVSPLGSDLDLVCTQLDLILNEVGYSSQVIKLSDSLKETEHIHGIKLKDETEDVRYETYMDAGNKLREKIKRMDSLALLAMAQIRAYRKKITGDHKKSINKKAYILRSIKNKKEIEILKSVYGPAFFVISIYSPREKRKDNLTKKIASSYNKPSQLNAYSSISERLIERDYDEQNEKYGQDVGGAFPLADLFVEAENSISKLKEGITRFINMIFSYPYHSPTKDEFGMFLAFSSALRSSDLSRQVGAVVTNIKGDLLTIGCNEVPKSGGGQYWEDDNGIKARDFELGYDSSAYMKKEVLSETISTLQELGFINKKEKAESITDELLYGEHANEIKKTDIANLLEYGRMVHAEMAAITDASRRGISLDGATLYCTTFPCHMCSRHIVASGIKRVVYVEPYPKSKASSLYKDSIIVDPIDPTDNKVIFEPFVGVSPYRFHDLFKHSKRKTDHGDIEVWSTRKARPKIKIYIDGYIQNETYCVNMVSNIIDDLTQ